MTDPSVRSAFRVWRENAGLSQAKVALSLNLKQPAVAQWEAGGRPDLAKALELQALTKGDVPASSWGYTEDQVEKVLRAAQFQTTSVDSGDGPAVDDEPSGPVVVTEGFSQVVGA